MIKDDKMYEKEGKEIDPIKLFKRLKYRPKSAKVKAYIIEKYQGLLCSAIREWKRKFKNIDIDDLASEANLAILIAMKNHRQGYTNNFAGYLQKILWTRLRDCCLKNSTQVKYPRRHLQYDKMAESSLDNNEGIARYELNRMAYREWAKN